MFYVAHSKHLFLLRWKYLTIIRRANYMELNNYDNYVLVLEDRTEVKSK